MFEPLAPDPIGTDPKPLAPDPKPLAPALYACVYQPPFGSSAGPACSAADVLTEVAEAFSPRYERHSEHLVTIDIRGLERLLGTPRTIGDGLRRDAAEHGL